MFTIKYRFYTLAPAQCAGEGPFYDQNESLHGPFEVISQHRDDGFLAVTCVNARDPVETITFGPHKADEAATAGAPAPRPVIWVMNESGATVARYDL